MRRTCGTCSRIFQKGSGLATHCSTTGHLPAALLAQESAQASTPCKPTRARYTYDQKIRCLERLCDLEEDVSCAWPWKQVCQELKLPRNKWNYVSRWRKRADHIRACVAEGYGTSTGYRQVRPLYPAEEDELYIRFLNRRIVHGYPANYWWLVREMRRILAESTPRGWKPDHCKLSWARAFARRYRISLQCGYNSKAQDILDRQELIKKFHQYIALLQASTGRNPRNAKYGRFGPRHTFHVDQVPLPFAYNSKRTLNPINAASCRICAPNTSGLEKRQATLQLWICADVSTTQPIKPSIIFRGTRGGRLPWKREQDVYDTLTNIRVHFQKNAWADEEFCYEDLLGAGEDLHAAGYTADEEVLMGMDRHGAQKTERMKELFNQLGAVPVYTPPGCTDTVSPVDHHVGRFIQNFMADCYQKELEKNPHIWLVDGDDIDGCAEGIEDPNSSSAMARRMLMAQWLSAAWEDLQTNHSQLLASAFLQTGFLIALDGSEDDLIKLQGWTGPKYKFR